ncbi:MAG: ATP-binding protein [Bacillota bacterium]
MKDLSLHILDLADNSFAAGADRLVIKLNEQPQLDYLTLTMVDNGRGMDENKIKAAVDPFYTSKGGKKVGLGLPFIKQNVERTGGNFNLISRINIGTTLSVCFKYNHIDRVPIGDIPESIISLIMLNPEPELYFIYSCHKKCYRFFTPRVKDELSPIPINNLEVLEYLEADIRSNFNKIRGENR